MSLSSKFSTLKATSTAKAPFVPLHSSSFIYLGQQQCEHCKMSFRNHSELLKHRKRCNRYRCPHCQRAFSERMINDFTCSYFQKKIQIHYQSILLIRISNWVICVVMSKFFILVLNLTNVDYVQKLTGKKYLLH